MSAHLSQRLHPIDDHFETYISCKALFVFPRVSVRWKSIVLRTSMISLFNSLPVSRVYHIHLFIYKTQLCSGCDSLNKHKDAIEEHRPQAVCQDGVHAAVRADLLRRDAGQHHYLQGALELGRATERRSDRCQTGDTD